MDITAPYIVGMGLELPPYQLFVAGLREMIREFRNLESQTPGTQLPFAHTVLEWAQKEYGAGFSEHLYRWGEDVFQYSGTDGAGAFLWDSIVFHGGLDGARDASPPPRLIRVLRGTLVDRGQRQVNRTTPMTSWDQQLWAKQAFDDLMNPFEFIQSTMRYYNFASAWQEAVKAAAPSADDSAAVEQWGLGVAKRIGMPLSQLGKPGEWPHLPSPWKQVS